jgi:hypothetical protein
VLTDWKIPHFLDSFDELILEYRFAIECRTAWSTFAADHEIDLWDVNREHPGRVLARLEGMPIECVSKLSGQMQEDP